MDEKKRNDDALFEALNKAKKKKRRKRWLTALIIIGIIVIALMITVTVLRRKVDARVATDEDKVLSKEAAYGSISTRVSGSGNIEDVDTETVTVPEGVEIDEVVVTANTKLREGDAIATLDLTSVLSTMAAVQDEIGELDKQLAEAKNDNVSSTLSAGVNGRLKKLYITPQADVAACMVENGALALISLDGKMAAEIENESLKSGDKVTVERADGKQLEGTVEKNVNGIATVLVTDNGPELDEQVRILDADGKLLGKAGLTIHSLFRLTGFAGTVAYISARENQDVYPATTICTLTNTATGARYNSILKQRGEKEETLLELLTLYQRGALCAPFDGTVIRIDYDENSSSANTAAPASTAQSDMSSYASAFGFSYPTASAGTTTAAKSSDEETDGIAVVKMAPDKSMKVSISVDENDILSLEKGQLAEVTIESVGKQAFTGLVTEVDRNAASGTSGTGAYAAEVTFAKEKGMLGGMTAEVVISIQGTDNVLIIPTDAVNKTAAGAFVYTEYDEETKQFGGITPIEVGISNDDDTEVRSGLKEGMTVYYTEKKEDLFFMMMGGPNGMNGRPNSRPGGSYPG